MRVFRAGVRLLVSSALSVALARASSSPAGRVAFPDSIKEVAASAPAGARPAPAVERLVLKASEASASMSVEVALRMRNFGELQARIARGEQISRAEMATRYFPLAADHDKLVRWLRAQGLEITRTDGNRAAVFVRGSVSAIAGAFGVSFARVTGVDGAEYTSAVTAPSLPPDISPAVLGIHGLQPHIKPHALSIPRASRPRLQVGGYLPAQIAGAYNATGLSATGAGQTIALYELAIPESTDLTSFWSIAGVSRSAGSVQTVTVGEGPTSPSANSSEEATLDAEWAGAMAPGATLRIYAANEDDPGENDEILQQVYADLPTQPALHQLCICIGGTELEVEKDYLIIEAQYMANLASAGVSIFSASGDDGAYAGPGESGGIQVTYPTSDPDVTGVGGTTLVLSGSGSVSSETAWSFTPGDSSSGATGGGVSVVFSRPSWQVGTGVPAGTMRFVPDVAAAADPNNGAYVYYQGGAMTIGGTSWATPIWTAFCALLNQGRSTPLGLLNPKIYPLIGTPAFRDITSGSNGVYSATTGYDECTGIGVPDMAALSADALSTPWGINAPADLGNIVTTVGQPATFFVVGEGTGTLSYQWQRQPDGSTTWTDLTDNGTYEGSATTTLVVNGTTLAMTGDQYRCIISSAGTDVASAAESLTVNQTGVTTIAGWPGSAGSADGTGWAARFAYPGSVRSDGAGNIYVADSFNNTVRRVTPAGVVTTVGGVAGKSGSTNGPVATALFNGTAGVAVDPSGNLFVADGSNYLIREISASGTVSTLAGSVGVQGVVNGTGTAAEFYNPQNLAIDSAGNLYVADGTGNVIRKVTPAGVVTTLAGTGIDGDAGMAGSADGTGAAAQFSNPTGIAVDTAGNVYVADYGNNTVRKITPGGVVTTLAGLAGASGSADGTGSAARFDAPAGVGVDAAGNVYVADSNNDTIREVTPGGVVTTVAGLAGDAENIDGLPGNARFSSPGDVAVDPFGVIYVADSLNMTIRRVIPGTASAPTITLEPADETVNLGSPASFSVGVGGTPPFTYQWSFDGAAIPGATGATYTLADAQTSGQGSYTVAVTNAQGSATSTAATLTVAVPPGYPDITAQPQGGTLASGGSVALSVTVTGTGPFTYQWYLNGAAIAGATAPAYAATSIGSYTVAVTNALASSTSAAAVVGSGSRLVNISTRALVGTGGNIAIAGISIFGPLGENKQVLIRGVGPALAASPFDLAGTLSSPTISVYDTSGKVIVSDTGWGNALVAGTSSVSATYRQATAADMASVGAFPLTTADSALVAYLPAGNYTVQMSGVGATTGVGLVEVYETDTSDPAVMTNISTRAQVETGGNILIGGIYVGGPQPATLLVRGVGPALGIAPFSLSGTLAQPLLSVYDSASTLVASNAGWGTAPAAGSSGVGASFRAATAADMAAVGAFGLPADSLDSAMVITLPPGAYTAEVTGIGGTTGIALVEVYQIEP